MDILANKNVESREDEEQSQKYFETIELLLAAGYFRARIKGLSPFDKVVGGMTWCIQTCEFDVDVDLLFQENSTIGQKIALTEKIVAVLPRMKCPQRIEPHQIQGLDFIHIFPVIQWLVKRAIETREILGDKIRAYSLSQFQKNFQLPQDKQFEKDQENSLKAIATFKDSYKPKRIYKKPVGLHTSDEETQVQTTLLEYGQKYGIIPSMKQEETSAAKQKAIAAGLVKVVAQEKSGEDEEKVKIDQLMKNMSQANTQQMPSSKIVSSIVGMQSDKISSIAEEYAERRKLLEQAAEEMISASSSGIAQSHSRKVNNIQKAIAEEQSKLDEVEKELETTAGVFTEAKENYEKHKEYSERLKIEHEKLEKKEQDETSRNLLDTLRSLVAQNEKLKEEERQFKQQCKDQVKEIESKIEELELKNKAEDDAEEQRLHIVDEQYEKEAAKLKKIKLLLAKRTREIASLQWKIDDVPSRAELSQYQRRFVELYNQVAATHKETKQYYTLYNTLDDTKLYLEKEISYLNSIHDGFEQASAQTESSKEEFLQQLEKIVQGVKSNKDKVEKKKELEKSKKDTLNSQLVDIIEKQRLYFKTVKDFQEECKKSEIILKKFQDANLAV